MRKNREDKTLKLIKLKLVQAKSCSYICIMKFDGITQDGRLWAVRYDEQEDNALEVVFHDWNDINYLSTFFQKNIADLERYFKISDIELAINDTLADAEQLECVVFDLNPDVDLDELFRPLDNLQASEFLLSKEKAKGHRISGHASWLRLYAIRFEHNSYLITGGAIKLTRTMAEREHTNQELTKLETVRQYLLENGVSDLNSFKDFLNTDNNDKNN